MLPATPYASLLAILTAAVLSAAPVLMPAGGPALPAPPEALVLPLADPAGTAALGEESAEDPASATPPSAEPSSPAKPPVAEGPPTPSAEAVRAAVAPALDASPGAVSATIRDALTGDVLYERDADAPVAPASGLKVLTAAAALRALGPERTLETRVVALPSATAGRTELVLVGGGDALLGTGASDAEAVAGRAGLRTLAREAAAELTERGVTGEVVVSTDLRLFEDDGLNPAWSDGLLAGGFISPVQPLATFGGRKAYGTAEERVPDPAAFAADVFQRHLADAVAAAGADLEVLVRDDVPATALPRADVLVAEPVATVDSAPLAEVVAYTLAHSENQVAETLARLAAHEKGLPATVEGVGTLLEQAAAELGADPAGMRVLDASGLAGGNRVSAAQLAAVVVAAAQDPALAPVLAGLPEPGEDSTLAERFLGTAAEGAVAAKTGTLEGTVSLAGTVTTGEGRLLAFSIIASELDWRLDSAREAVDAAVVALAEQ